MFAPLGLAATLQLRRRSGVFWMKNIIPNYLFTFICLLAGLLPASAPLPRLAVMSLMILLVLLTVPPHLPPLSFLATILSQNLLLEILLLLQTILITCLIHFSVEKSNAVRIIKIADLVILVLLFFAFIITHTIKKIKF